MIEVDKENFEEEVLAEDGVVLVDFWGESCDKCLELMPEVEAMEEKYGDEVKFTKVKIKGNRRLAMRHQVMGLPSIVFFVDGEKDAHLKGDDLEASDIEDQIKKYL
jgi:thioredoxin 1